MLEEYQVLQDKSWQLHKTPGTQFCTCIYLQTWSPKLLVKLPVIGEVATSREVASAWTLD